MQCGCCDVLVVRAREVRTKEAPNEYVRRVGRTQRRIPLETIGARAVVCFGHRLPLSFYFYFYPSSSSSSSSFFFLLLLGCSLVRMGWGTGGVKPSVHERGSMLQCILLWHHSRLTRKDRLVFTCFLPKQSSSFRPEASYLALVRMNGEKTGLICTRYAFTSMQASFVGSDLVPTAHPRARFCLSLSLCVCLAHGYPGALRLLEVEHCCTSRALSVRLALYTEIFRVRCSAIRVHGYSKYLFFE